MKLFRFILTAFFAFLLTSGLNAQVFVGGGFGVSSSGGNFDNGNQQTDRPSEFDFNFSPVVGKFLSEKMAIGLSLNLGLSVDNNNAAIETIDTQSSFGLTPFVRYYVITAGKFSVFGQGNLGFAFSSSKSKTGGTTTDGPKNTQVSFQVVPGLAYELNEKISLETAINVFSLGYSINSSKVGDNVTTNYNSRLGLGLNNIANVGNINIGAIFKF